MHTAPMTPKIEATAPTPQLDHLVVAASTLAEGVAWCEATLGLHPGPGGEHALFGTHNRLLRLHCAGAPHAYLEIIAIQPGAEPMRPAPAKRWFDLDAPAMRAALATQGPQLVHWVVSVPDLQGALNRCRAVGIDRGAALAASRPTPQGLLEWQISVREDGQRLLGGCLPTLIQWGGVHPAQTLPDSGLTLQSLALQVPDAPALSRALSAFGAQGLVTRIAQGPARLTATLTGPAGPVILASGGH